MRIIVISLNFLYLSMNPVATISIVLHVIYLTKYWIVFPALNEYSIGHELNLIGQYRREAMQRKGNL